MPIYEYQCEDCTHAFEQIVRKVEDGVCPECGSRHLTKQLSTFAPSAGKADAPLPSCGTCGVPGGPCAMN